MPLDHGTVIPLVDSPRVALGFSACGANVFLLDDEPIRLKAEAVRLELTIPMCRDACFRDRFLIRPDHFRSLSCGGWSRTNIETFRASHPAVRRPRSISHIHTVANSGRRVRTSVS